MKYTVVQWIGEDGAVSIVSEKDITSPEEEILEGKEVVIMMRGDNNKAKIFEAVVLKVFDTRAKAKEYEQQLVKPIENSAEDLSNTKRKRKPSRKAKESTDINVEPEQSQSDASEGDKELQKEKSINQNKKTKKKKETGAADDNKLQEVVQSNRVQAILACRSTAGKKDENVIVSDDDEDDIRPLQGSTTQATTAASSQPQRPPTTQPVCTPFPRPSFTQPTTLPAPPPIRSPGTSAPTALSRPTPNIATKPVQPSQQTNSFMSLPSTPPTPVPYLTSACENPPVNGPFMSSTWSGESSFTELLNSPSIHHPPQQEWELFAQHFTLAFEGLKAEVDVLKSEVKYLKGKLKERKASQQAPEADRQQSLFQEEMIKNIQPPREALKTLLYYLFTEEELKTQSLKGVATKGSAGKGMDKSKVGQLNTAMKNVFPTVSQSQVDDWIRGQQKKI